MSGVNKVILIGNIGHTPEIKTTDNGNKIASFSIATSEIWKDKARDQLKLYRENKISKEKFCNWIEKNK